MNPVAVGAGLGASYLLGAIPTSLLVSRWAAGIDLRTVGSGNLGATNLYRQLGWKYAVPVGAFDLLKGTVPVAVLAPLAGATGLVALGFGVVAVLGHVFPVFAGFKGGKGVATGAGVVLALAPWAFLAALATWLVVLKATGYVSLASIMGAVVFPVATWLAHPEQRPVIWVHLLLAALIVLLHRANIQRLVRGTEHRFGRAATGKGGGGG